MARLLKSLMLATIWLFTLGVHARAIDPIPPASSLLRKHFTIEEGLPGSVVGQMAQTQDGFLWMVINGVQLARFDGKSFHVFDTPIVWSLAVAPDGALWVGGLQHFVRVPPSSFNQFKLADAVSYHP
ncbi:MAG TPA: hypothetical protein VFY61_14630, partial [Pyrinomonadaceae bacterium]|nr:hypothetical protein [Pyrinomonadaceae bacterium]